jgi:hypothetical protein
MKICPAFYGTRRLINVFKTTAARPCPNQSRPHTWHSAFYTYCSAVHAYVFQVDLSLQMSRLEFSTPFLCICLLYAPSIWSAAFELCNFLIYTNCILLMTLALRDQDSLPHTEVDRTILFSSSCPLYTGARSHIGAQGWLSVSWSFTDGITTWTGDQLVTRPPPKHSKTRTHIKRPCARWDSNPQSKTVHASDRSATATGDSTKYLTKFRLRMIPYFGLYSSSFLRHSMFLILFFFDVFFFICSFLLLLLY